MILATHPKKGNLTFDSLEIFKNIKDLEPEWILINSNYDIKKEEKKIIVKKVEKVEKINFVEPEEVEEEPDFNTSDYKLSEFKENIHNFSHEELEMFANDKRKTIANLAKKYL